MKNQNSTQRRKDAKTPRKNQPSGFWPLSSAFAPLLLCAFALNLFADDSAHIVVSARDFGQSSLARRNVTLTPLAPLRRTVTTNLFSIEPRSLPTDTNGVCTFSNTLWGYYRLDLSGTPGTSFNLVLGTNQSGLVSAAALVTNSVTLPPNPATNYYTMAQADAIHAGITGGSGQTNWPADSITNAPWIGSSGVAYTVADGWSILGASNVAIQTQIGQLILKAGELQFWETNRIKGGIKGGILSIDGSGITNLPATLYTNGAADLLPGQIVLATIGTNTLNITNRYGGNSFGLTNLNGLPYRYLYMTNGQSVYPVFYGFAGGTPGIDGLATNWPGVVFLDTNGTQAGQIFYIGDHAIDGYGTYAAHGEMQMLALGDIAIRPGTGGNLNDSWIQLGNSSTLGDTHIAPAYIPARGSNGLALGTFVSGIYTNIGTTNMPASGTLSFTTGGSPSARPAIQAINVSGLQGQSPWTGNPDRGYGGLLFWASPPVPGQSQGGTPYYYDASPGVLSGAMDGTNGWWLNGVLSANGSGLTNLPAAAITAPPWQIGSAALTNWATDGFLPYYDGEDWRGIYAASGSPTNALIWDSGNLLWRLGTNANQLLAGAFTGNGRGLTNLVAAAALGTNTGNNVGWSLTNGVLALYTNSATPKIILHPNGNQTNSGDFGFGSGVSVIRSTGGAVFGAGISGTSANFSSSLNWGSGNTLSCARFMLGSGSANTMSIFDSTLGSTIPAAASVISNWPTFRISSSNNVGLALNCSLTVTNGLTNFSAAPISSAGPIFGASAFIALSTNVSCAMPATVYTNLLETGLMDYTNAVGSMAISADGAITNFVAGRYFISVATSFEGAGANSLYEGAIFTNNVECTLIEWERDVATTVGSAAANGILFLPANCRIGYRIKSPDAETAVFHKIMFTVMGAN